VSLIASGKLNQNFMSIGRFYIASALKILSIFCLSIQATFAQSESKKIRYNWKEAPVYLSGSGQINRFKSESNGPYPIYAGYEAGLFVDYALMQQYPFRGGFEYQMRGFSLDDFSEGTTNSGKRYRKTITGKTEFSYLQLSSLFKLGRNMPEKKLRFVLGPSAGIRLMTRQKFTYIYEIPSDSIRIEGKADSGSDALDLVEINAIAGVFYSPHPRIDICLRGTYKLFGFSIAKENFISRTERNSMLSISLMYRFSTVGNLSFF